MAGLHGLWGEFLDAVDGGFEVIDFEPQKE